MKPKFTLTIGMLLDALTILLGALGVLYFLDTPFTTWLNGITGWNFVTAPAALIYSIGWYIIGRDHVTIWLAKFNSARPVLSSIALVALVAAGYLARTAWAPIFQLLDMKKLDPQSVALFWTGVAIIGGLVLISLIGYGWKWAKKHVITEEKPEPAPVAPAAEPITFTPVAPEPESAPAKSAKRTGGK